MRKPFWRKAYQCWYVKDAAGSFIRLDPDKSRAEDIWEEMIAAGCAHGRLATVLGITEAFLAEHEPMMSEATFGNVANYVLSFADSMGPGMLVSKITKGRLIAWLKESKPGRLLKNKDPDDKTERRGLSKVWSLHGQRDAGRSVARVFRWAHNEGMIARNPLADLRLESPQPRQAVIDPAVHAKLVTACQASVQSRSFSLYLIASHCGARPQQIRNVTAANVSASIDVWVFYDHKTKKKTQKPLVVYLSPCLRTLTRILMHARPTGSLFLNDRGQPWKKDTVCQRMERLRESLHLDGSVIAYAYRHTMITDSLRAGNDIATVAALAGHTSTVMVSRVYSHLDKHPQHLIDAAAKTAAKRHSSDK